MNVHLNNIFSNHANGKVLNKKHLHIKSKKVSFLHLCYSSVS